MFVCLNYSPIQSAKCFKCARKYIAILFTQIAERGVYKGVDMCMCGGPLCITHVLQETIIGKK
jgi:hypothetical protein